MKEIWKDIPEYEGYYQASNLGNIKSLERKVTYSNGAIHYYSEKIRKPSLSEYRLIALSKDGKVKMCKISRIIAKLFVEGRCDKNNIVNHIDGNKHNDKYDNLEWCTYSKNSLHSFDSGLRTRKNKTPGVFFDEKRNKWCSYLYRNSKNIFVGRFDNLHDAIYQRKLKLNEYDRIENKTNER